MDISKAREQIYDYFQASEKCQKFFLASENEERYSGYYTSIYLIQDTNEGVEAHRAQGFSKNPLIAYIELWGVMQAIYIQQDSISQLYRVITGCELESSLLKKWQELRVLRNICAGHPAKKDRPKNTPLARTFMGRNFGNYSEFTYEKWKSPDKVSHPRVELSSLITAYELEAAEVLKLIHGHMKKKWPK